MDKNWTYSFSAKDCTFTFDGASAPDFRHDGGIISGVSWGGGSMPFNLRLINHKARANCSLFSFPCSAVSHKPLSKVISSISNCTLKEIRSWHTDNLPYMSKYRLCNAWFQKCIFNFVPRHKTISI